MKKALAVAALLALVSSPALAQGYEGVLSPSDESDNTYYGNNAPAQPPAGDLYGFVAGSDGTQPTPGQEPASSLDEYVAESGMTPSEKLRERQKSDFAAQQQKARDNRLAKEAARQERIEIDQKAFKEQQAKQAAELKKKYGIVLP